MDASGTDRDVDGQTGAVRPTWPRGRTAQRQHGKHQRCSRKHELEYRVDFAKDALDDAKQRSAYYWEMFWADSEEWEDAALYAEAEAERLEGKYWEEVRDLTFAEDEDVGRQYSFWTSVHRRGRELVVSRPRRLDRRLGCGGRPRAQSTRSSARSGDSGSSEPADPEPPWRWRSDHEDLHVDVLHVGEVLHVGHVLGGGS